MTAKSTQFGKGTFTSWLIENSGAVPLQRKMDFAEGTSVDNSNVMNKLYQASIFLDDRSSTDIKLNPRL